MENQETIPALEPQPSRSAGIGAKLICIGTLAGIVLRMVQMLYFFDYDAGFATDNNLYSWLSLGAIVLFAVVGCVLSLRSQGLGEYGPRRNPSLGLAALLSGGLLIASGILQATDYASFLRTGISSYDASERGVIHVIFFSLCFVFGLFQLINGVGFLRGSGGMAKAPLLQLIGVAWGVSYLLLVYVFYAKSPSFTENIYAVAGGACLLLSLFYLCELMAGVSSQRASRRLYIFGLFAVPLNITYAVSNLVLRLLGKRYVGEIHPIIQLACLGAALYLLVFLLTFQPVAVENSGKRFRKE